MNECRIICCFFTIPTYNISGIMDPEINDLLIDAATFFLSIAQFTKISKSIRTSILSDDRLTSVLGVD